MSFSRLQYLGCTLLRYSLTEYRTMYTSDIMSQIDVWMEMNGVQDTTQDDEGVQF